MSYTVASVLAVAATILLDLVVLRTRLVTRRAFWVAYAIVLVFQILTNGWLTSRGVVVYDPGTITGFRVAHAPVEDIGFGFSLVTGSLAWWVWWGRRERRREAVSQTLGIDPPGATP